MQSRCEVQAASDDLEAEWTQDAIQRVATENTTLKQRIRQLTADNRTLDPATPR